MNFIALYIDWRCCTIEDCVSLYNRAQAAFEQWSVECSCTVECCASVSSRELCVVVW